MALRVVIADDEVHICSLLKHVIEWERLGLELAGVYHNGNDVVAHFEKDPADILICDIEMPGMTGNELIRHMSENWPACRCMVLSGFRNFEYARNAMQFGVTNYLLKPVDGDELNSALEGLIQEGKAQLSDTISEQSIRLGLLSALERGLEGETLTSLNNKYHYQLRQGVFNVVKAVFTDIDVHSDFLPKVITIFSDSIKQQMLDFCFEVEVFRATPVSAVVLINYANPDALPQQVFDKILRDTMTDIGGKTQCKCFVGAGITVDGVAGLPESYRTARVAAAHRMRGEGRQIYYAGYMEPSLFTEDPALLGADARRALQTHMEAVDIPGMRQWVENSFRENDKAFATSPYQAFSFCLQALEAAIAIFDDLNVPIADKDAFRKNAEMRLDACSSFTMLKATLSAVLESEISKRLHDKQQNMAVYAQQAKNYIDKHYASEVSLERIAEKLHISPVYLSVVFKSETGMNYSKYLASVRVEKAKQLLKSCDMNMSQVANAVGYDSTNYFSNLFRKHTGLKPSEYRRLHQQDIGE